MKLDYNVHGGQYRPVKWKVETSGFKTMDWEILKSEIEVYESSVWSGKTLDLLSFYRGMMGREA